jgi:hypothetical protein
LLIDSIDFLTTDSLIGQPPNDVIASYGELLVDYLVVKPNSKQATTNNLSKGM